MSYDAVIYSHVAERNCDKYGSSECDDAYIRTICHNGAQVDTISFEPIEPPFLTDGNGNCYNDHESETLRGWLTTKNTDPTNRNIINRDRLPPKPTKFEVDPPIRIGNVEDLNRLIFAWCDKKEIVDESDARHISRWQIDASIEKSDLFYHFAIADELRLLQIDVNEPSGVPRITPLQYAISPYKNFNGRRFDAIAVSNLLKIEGIDVNAKDDDGDTALHVAAERGDPDILSSLIDAGAEVNAKNKFDVTPLYVAVSARHSEKDVPRGSDWSDDETADLLKKRLEELSVEARLPQCAYNNCLREFIRTLANSDVKFKVFGGAAYVHHACGDESAETDATSPCRTHDVDLYLHDEAENKKKFEDALKLLKTKYRFDESKEGTREFAGHKMMFLKWTASVGPGDDAHEVEHGVDVHYVGDEFEDSSGRKVRLWDDWSRIPWENRHFVTKERLCKTLDEMVVNGGASSMDGENKGARRKNRRDRLCVRPTGRTDRPPTIDSGGLALSNPYGGKVPEGAGLREMAKRTVTKVLKEKAKKVAEGAGKRVNAAIFGTNASSMEGNQRLVVSSS